MEPQTRRQQEQADGNKTTGTKDTIAANKAATGTTTNRHRKTFEDEKIK
jgi:hypothetical protein